jgi:SNF family Na+-dependent transporter
MSEEDISKREVWGSRIGLILAAAGNAVGIGNFLRFPTKAAVNGGGAFMIPYVCALLLLGIPLMWIEWGIGRYGGKFGHGSTPGMFDRLWRNPIAKYLGVLGVMLPLTFAMYYTFAESWCLGYSFLSTTGFGNVADFEVYLREYQNAINTTEYFDTRILVIAFFVVTFLINMWIMYRGLGKGIELLAKIGMPLLFLFAIVLVVYVLNLGNPRGKGHVLEGLAYIWTPDFSAIGNAAVWMAAAGQIFFTLSIGTGSLETYASYLREKNDIVLTGLTTASTNEFVEVILGGSLAIPATAAFYGPAMVKAIAEKGTFNLGFVAMPEILRGLGAVEILGAMWFFLLFIAALTSSVALAAPVRAFFIDELKLKKGNSTLFLGIIWLLGSLPVVLFFKYGFLDEIDFWVGTLGLVVFACIEVILFMWIFGGKRAWQEMHLGCDIKIPRVFYPIMLVITPIYLLVLLGWWAYDGIKGGILEPKPDFTYSIRDKELAGKIKAIDKSSIIKALKEEKHIWENGDDQEAVFRVNISSNGKVEDVIEDGRHSRFSGFIAENIRKWTFEPKDKNDAIQRATFSLYTRGLNCPPYLWGARFLIIGIYVLFAVMTFFVWRRRARPKTV